MAREKPYYRDTIAELRSLFGKDIVRISEVAEIFNITKNQARSRYEFDKGGYITVYKMAHQIVSEF